MLVHRKTAGIPWPTESTMSAGLWNTSGSHNAELSARQRTILRGSGLGVVVALDEPALGLLTTLEAESRGPEGPDALAHDCSALETYANSLSLSMAGVQQNHESESALRVLGGRATLLFSTIELEPCAYQCWRRWLSVWSPRGRCQRLVTGL
jgi:hypothetical protein